MEHSLTMFCLTTSQNGLSRPSQTHWLSSTPLGMNSSSSMVDLHRDEHLLPLNSCPQWDRYAVRDDWQLGSSSHRWRASVQPISSAPPGCVRGRQGSTARLALRHSGSIPQSQVSRNGPFVVWLRRMSALMQWLGHWRLLPRMIPSHAVKYWL